MSDETGVPPHPDDSEASDPGRRPAGHPEPSSEAPPVPDTPDEEENAALPPAPPEPADTAPAPSGLPPGSPYDPGPGAPLPVLDPGSAASAGNPYAEGGGSSPAMPRPPVPAPRTGPGIGTGIGLGCGAHVLGVLFMLGALGAMLPFGGMFGILWPFVLIAVVSLGLLIPERTRRVGAGMTIIAAATWIVLIGPCLAILGGL